MIPKALRDEAGILPGDGVYPIATERGVLLVHIPQAEIEAWLASNSQYPDEANSAQSHARPRLKPRSEDTKSLRD